MRKYFAIAAALLASACAESPAARAPALAPQACPLTAGPRVQVFGALGRPGPLPYEPGLTVYAAIERAGGFTYTARKSELRIIRCGRPFGPFPAPAAPGADTDLPLQLGDVLDVPMNEF